MERVMFAKLEVWLVLILLLIEGLGAVLFAAFVLRAERQTSPLASTASTALAIAEMPETVRDMLRGQAARLIAQNQAKFDGKPTGWAFPSGPLAAPAGYILLSRYDGTIERDLVELVSMPDMQVRYTWKPNHEKMLEMITRERQFTEVGDRGAAIFREIHPWVTDTGHLVVKDHSTPLYGVDPCGEPQWINEDESFHHSTEPDADGNLWIAGTAEQHTFRPVRHDYREDTLVKVSPSGKILQRDSLVQILMRHGYTNLLFPNDNYNFDTLHLNDVQPVLEDGPYWKKGDVFASLRNISTILLYRPSTGKIVWMKRGPWMAQHDVDVLDDHRISVYDNQAQDRGVPGADPMIDGFSRILVYDFASGEVSSPLDEVMAREKIKTATAGLYTLLPDGSAMIEDVTEARLFIIGPDGRLAADYTNRDASGRIAMLGWSRYIEKPRGDAILANLRRVDCAA